jgi:hypothetical protein
MRRFLALAVCGLSLGACTSGDLFKLDAGQVTLQLESEPPGADARLSTGATCKTPCAAPASTATGELTVTYTLEGYQPQEATVQIVQSLDPREDPARAVPNPVFVELVAVPKPSVRRRPARPRAAPKKPAAKQPAANRPAARRPAAARRAAQPAAAPPEPAAPEPAAAQPAASQAAPWPAPAAEPAPASSAPWPAPPRQQ